MASSAHTPENFFPELLADRRPAAYQDLISQAADEWQAVQGTAYLVDRLQSVVAADWRRFYIRLATGAGSIVFEHLRGKRVVDLGCGPVVSDFQDLLGEYEPSYYIGVDQGMRFIGREVAGESAVGPYTLLNTEAGDPLNGVLVRADMLDLVSRLPNRYGSYVMNGVDAHIIEGESPYAAAVMDEIVRTTPEGGVVLGTTNEGGMLTELAKRPEFETERLLPDWLVEHTDAGFFQHTKIST